MIKRLTKVRLPDEYQRVEYLESTTSQYIYTGLGFSYPVMAEGKIQYMGEEPTANKAIFSPIGSSNASAYIGVDVSKKWSLGSSYSVSVSWNDVLQFKYEKEVSNGIAKLTDQFNKSASRSGTPNRTNTCLFRISQSSSTVPQRIYYIKISDSSKATHLIPCYRKSDNVAGMYDLVSGQFFVNQGTGKFLVGEDVNDPIEVWHTVKSIKSKVGGTMKDIHTIKRVVDGTLRTITI